MWLFGRSVREPSGQLNTQQARDDAAGRRALRESQAMQDRLKATGAPDDRSAWRILRGLGGGG